MTIPPFSVSAEAINRIAEISALLERHNIAKYPIKYLTNYPINYPIKCPIKYPINRNCPY